MYISFEFQSFSKIEGFRFVNKSKVLIENWRSQNISQNQENKKRNKE